MTLTKISSDAYTYAVTKLDDGGSDIALVQTVSGKLKSFFIAGSISSASIEDHMASLTDSQCEQWFNAGERKKNKPAK